MTQKLPIGLLLGSALLILSGCGSTNNKPDTTTTVATDLPTIKFESCNRYIDYMRCIATAKGGEGGTQTQEALNQTIKNRGTYDDESLLPLCEGAVKGLEQVQAMYAQYDCEL